MIALICAGFLIVSVSHSLPNVESIKSVELKVPLRIYSSEGLLISEFGNERRKPISLEQTPYTLINAVLSSEDDRFYEHRGIDLSGLARAALSNMRSGATQQGASTITMQVARNFFLTPEKTYIRKLREVLLSFKLEQILTKDEILHLYLNKIFLGHRAYGFGAAAEVYYGRELNQLTLAELAMLAGLPKAPSTNNPLRNPERAVSRRNYVLGRMFELGHINEADYQDAISAEVTATKHAKQIELFAPHIAEMVRAQLLKDYGEAAYWAGLDVHTTIKAAPQEQAQRSLRAGLKSYDKRHGFRGAIARLELPELDAPTAHDSSEQVAEPNDQKSQVEILDALLKDFPPSQEQLPALVLSVEEESAQIYNSEHGYLSLNLSHARWARRHLTANLRGDRPETMSDVLTNGDVIYIEPRQVSKEEPEDSPKWKLSQIPNVSGALISLEPSTGRILSLVGGYDFFLNKYNRAVQSIRQPGSNIKPFIYSAALDKGFSPASLISGTPIVITDPTHGTVWRPENYSGKFYGPTRMREALAKSMNLVSIRLLRSIGIPYTREYLDRFGIDMNRFSSSLTMALGAGGITPIELLSAYGVIANGGYRVEPYFIDHIVNRNGDIVYRAATPEFCDECYQEYLPQPDIQVIPLDTLAETDNEFESYQEPEEETDIEIPELPIEAQQRNYSAPRVMNRANNFLTQSMLREVIKRGTARKALVLNREDLAGKTGTTNDYVDAWFSGFNSDIATTVWIGFDDPSTMGRGEAGSKSALPIWVDYMQHALKDVPKQAISIPNYIRSDWVDRNTGKQTDEFNSAAVAEFFPIEELLPEPFGEIGLQQYLTQKQIELESGGLPLYDIDKILSGKRSNQALDEIDLSTLPERRSERPRAETLIEQEEETEGLF